MSAFDNATLMITGGTGSFGSTVLKHFLDSDLKEIRIFSRDEKKQDDMRHELQAKHPENAKNERGRPRQFHGTCAHAGLRTGVHQYQQARHHQGAALAQQQVGAVHRGARPWPHSGAEHQHRRDSRVRGKQNRAGVHYKLW